VLARAVNSGITSGQIASLEASLGKADGSPPFSRGTNNTASRGGFDYRLFVGATREGLEATAIAVT